MLWRVSIYLKMMSLACMCLASFSLPVQAAGMQWFGGGETILTHKEEDVISDSEIEDGQPLRSAQQSLAEGLVGMISVEIEDTDTAWERGTKIVQTIINYALALLGLLALVYLLYHGFLALTARDDDEQLNKGMRGVKYAVIAIIGIALTASIVSLIFWVVFNVTSSV